MKLYPLELSDLRWEDRRFVYSFPTRDYLLKESIKRVGVIEPPVVLETPEGLVPVCGEGRLLAARSLGFSALEVRLLKGISPLEALELSLESNLFRGLNLVEKAEIISRFSRYLSPEEVAQKVLPRLELPPTPRWYFFLRRLSEAPQPLKQATAEERLPLKVTEELLKLPPPEQIFLLEVFERLGLSFSEQRETLAGLLDLCRRHELSLKELWEREFGEIKDRRSFMQRLRQLLRPEFSKTLERFNRWRSLLAEKGLELEIPPALEKDVLLLKIPFKNLEELNSRLQDLRDLSTRMKNS